jgi:hypothetical protein
LKASWYVLLGDGVHDGEVVLLEVLYVDGVDWYGGARSPMATMVFSSVSLSETCI